MEQNQNDIENADLLDSVDLKEKDIIDGADEGDLVVGSNDGTIIEKTIAAWQSFTAGNKRVASL